MKTTSCRRIEGQILPGGIHWTTLTRTCAILGAVLMTLASLTAARAEEQTLTIPSGTILRVKLDKAISSSDKPGTAFTGVLQGDLSTNDVVAVKSGSAVSGKVMDAKKARRVRGKAKVVFELDQVSVKGQPVAIETEPVADTAASSTKKTAKGAAKGAAMGAIADGGEGASKGAAVGAAASALKKGENAGFKAGDIVEFKLAAPLTVTVTE